MSNTVTNYLSRLNKNFPVRGQKNNSQVFRDNWQNIFNAVSIINFGLEELQTGTVNINDYINFNNNTIENVNFKNFSTELYTLDTQSGLIEIDYELGSYQKFDLLSGEHIIEIKNWPSGLDKSSRLFLSITTNGVSTIVFTKGIGLGFEKNQYVLDSDKTYLFELKNEKGSDQYFLKLINFTLQTLGTETVTTIYEKLELGDILNSNQRNVFTANTETNKNFATVVTRSTSTVKVGELGLVPNRITKIIRGASNGPGSNATLTFDNITDIKPGATFYIPLSSSNTRYTVVNAIVGSTTSLEISPNNFNVGDLSINVDVITFTNPTFNDQPTLLTLAPLAANTSTGSKNNYIGSVYANRNRLEITYNNFGNNNHNTFVVQTHHTSTDTSYYNTDIVPTSFFHYLLPIGAVVLWHGRLDNIPYGWSLCDGRTIDSLVNGQPGPAIRTPDLRDRFIVCGKDDYYNTSTGIWCGSLSTITGPALPDGGFTDISIAPHTHNAFFTSTSRSGIGEGVEMQPHQHPGGISEPHIHDTVIDDVTYNYLLVPPYAGSLTGAEQQNGMPVAFGDAGPIIPNNFIFTTTVNTVTFVGSAGTPTGIVRVLETGEDPEYKNIPPFVGTYYIIKITGNSDINKGILA